MIRLLFILMMFCPFTVFAGMDLTVEGRVFTEHGPLPGARVMLYTGYQDIVEGKPVATSSPADAKGVYALKAPPGDYFIVARGLHDGREYHAYHGNSPLHLEKESVWVALQAVPIPPAPAYVPGETGIEGRLLFKGEPVQDGYVALYPPGSRTFKGLGVKTVSAGGDGRFRIPVSSGRYVVIGKKMAGGKSNRPLQKGDLYCYYPHNPVEVREGETARIELSCYPKNDRDLFVTTPQVKDNELKTVAEQAASGTGIRGRVLDRSGKPVSGMMVLAYRLAAPVFQMYHVYHGTEYSAMTDAAGTFFIPIDQDGDYGLVARDVLGDGPHSGETYGLYQGNARHAVTYRKGSMVENISITVGKVMSGEPRPEPSVRKPAKIVGTRGGKPVVVRDSVIEHDTVWQGEIRVEGVVSVQRGATLTVLPGTTVRFKRIDRDHNEIGDGEIMVEGRIVARGTKDRPIVFTSAERKPKVNDWSYLQFLAADPENVIEHCRFEYAFAGVMIHYAQVRIADTVFRNNNRGVHYNTANLQVEHCTFTDNRIGIRFMRLEGEVRITDNEITRNDLGVLFVRQHVNAVDFERLNKGTQPPRFQRNNIYGNRTYNFSLGEGQDRDVEVPENWWGSPERDKVAAGIYDGTKDEELSRVFFEPFLDAPVAGAGARRK
ncbi:right-handed parallel beta-helix repeat-containing protein [Geobacter sp. DSM 9736]|uniref:right-handed parallel beta-helix repeat-containing protein n=1 Tax=Geobacter sp. DSM 9736 TaxID=1277350 RepID=UPI0012FDCF8E|nr:right-handed parallel beta-helix repeat-containing protein [Geobacter sp. DSM 9736]